MKRTLLSLAVACIVAAPLAAADMSGAEAKIAASAQRFAAAWDKHDAKAMAAVFTEKGTLINPFGRMAAGRAQIEALFHDEQTGMMAGTSYDVKVERVDWVTPEVAVVQWASTVHGMKGADGKPMDLPHQVTVVEQRVGDEWLAAAARPVVYPPPPAMPAK